MSMCWRIIFSLLLTAMVTLQGQAAIARSEVPFNGSDVGTFDVPTLCVDGTANVVIEGEGTATHLGKYSYEADECFNPATGTFGGTATFTAANGDQFWGTYTGLVAPTSDPDVITYTEILTITGGSGRFAGTDGVFQVVGVANLATGDYHQSLRGWISNPGRTSGS